MPINRDDYGTPTWLLDLARLVLGEIDLDPFSSAWHNARRVHALKYYGDNCGNGLTRPWSLQDRPSRVWCNPPYSRYLIGACVTRWIGAASHDEMLAGLILTNVDTSTRWCQTLMEYPHCMLRKRVAFVHPNQGEGEPLVGNRSPQMVTYAGTRYPTFCRVFGEHGIIR